METEELGLLIFHFLYLRTINIIIIIDIARQTMIVGMLITPDPTMEIIQIMGAIANTPRTRNHITHDVV